MESLKRVVIKEEFVAITEDVTEAVILNQFLYWSERVRDFDKFIQEENQRRKKDSIQNDNQEYTEQPLTYGWIYKKAAELEQEIMNMASERTINRKMDSLVEKGFLDRRNNPELKYDRTYQYRINFINLIGALLQKGYTLQGYKVDMIECLNTLKNSNRQNDVWNMQDEENETDITEYMESKESFDDCKRHNVALKRHDVGAIPEITTENNNIYIYSQSVNNNIYSDNEQNDVSRGETMEQLPEKEMIKETTHIIQTMGYPCLIEEMVINSLIDIIKTKDIKLMGVLRDKRIIDFAINKFKKLDKTRISNYKAYFTSMLINSVNEYAASEVAGQEQLTDAAKRSKNKFHNFTQNMTNYSEEELENIARKKLNAKIKELKTCR